MSEFCRRRINDCRAISRSRLGNAAFPLRHRSLSRANAHGESLKGETVSFAIKGKGMLHHEIEFL